MYFRLKKTTVALIIASVFSSTFLTSKPAQAQDACIGSIMLTGANFCPRGYADANGQLFPISQNTALFSLFGTMYGGDGRSSFALPDLRSRSPMHIGTGPGLSPVTQGQRLGAEHTTVSIANMPAHTHDLNATSTVANTSSPGQDLLARGQFYANGPTNKVMGSTAIGSTGGGTPIPTRSPALGLRYCVAMQGLFCSRN